MKSRQSRCHRVHKAVVIDSQSLSLLITDCRQYHRCSSLLLFEMSTPSKKRKDGASLFDMLCQMEDKVCNMASSNKIQTGIRDYFTRFNADSFS
ncbi:hypothetical protein PoB_001130000 [Plakobranchus ocellatus]|uniref:Uncharacterized protein n=1 Tax=Plakobranchus ocellatus TaxID=259542 RepID=A0AAV3YQ05_9GAST|nr:hypothetical protein PoB_001130000 [Plakobranchus ocellatus]